MESLVEKLRESRRKDKKNGNGTEGAGQVGAGLSGTSQDGDHSAIVRQGGAAPIGVGQISAGQTGSAESGNDDGIARRNPVLDQRLNRLMALEKYGDLEKMADAQNSEDTYLDMDGLKTFLRQMELSGDENVVLQVPLSNQEE